MPGGQRRDELPPVKNEILTKIIKNGDAISLNELAIELGELYSKSITTSQIRKFHANLLKIDEFDENRLHMLRPVLAYSVGKASRGQKYLRHLRDNVETCIIIVNDKNSFKNFKNFFEAIIAYHRFHGGKE